MDDGITAVFQRVTPLDVFNETLGHLPAVFVVTIPDIKQDIGTFTATLATTTKKIPFCGAKT